MQEHEIVLHFMLAYSALHAGALCHGFILGLLRLFPWPYFGLQTGFHVAGPGRVRRFRRFRRRLGDRRRPPGGDAAAGKFWLYTKTLLP